MDNFGENLSRMAVNETPLQKTDIEIGSLQEMGLSLELEKEKIQNYKSRTARYRSNTILRVVFSAIYTGILIFWIGSVLSIVKNNHLHSYNLSDAVLIGLLVTSTANVTGLVLIVLKNLFPVKNTTVSP